MSSHAEFPALKYHPSLFISDLHLLPAVGRSYSSRLGSPDDSCSGVMGSDGRFLARSCDTNAKRALLGVLAVSVCDTCYTYCT